MATETGETAPLYAEIDSLRALVSRLTDVADDLAAQLYDPGAEALSAIYCGRNLIYG